MRIVQVVTYISPDGAYGGPVRVAINQTKSLIEMGHDVVLVAAAGGFNGPLPTTFDGLPVKLFPARRVIPRTGFAGISSPALIRWLHRTIPTTDAVHVHLARDLVSLPSALIALYARKHLAVQTHGMIDTSTNLLSYPLDLVLTRPILRKAKAVLYLTDRERNDLAEVAGTLDNLVHLPNGVQVPEIVASEQQHGPHDNPEVLFLARMHQRKRPLQVVHAAESLRALYPEAQFSLVGPDEGEGARILAKLKEFDVHSVISWSGPLPPDHTLTRMSQASIFVLPSIDEPFPMSVLEAMSIGLPVVVTKSCGLAPAIEKYRAGIVCNPTQSEFTASVRALLQDPQRRISMGKNARQAISKSFQSRTVANRLLEIYSSQ